MVGYLSKKPKLSFVDDSGKLYMQRRRATQAKGMETLDSKAKVEGPSESPGESPPPSLKEDQPQPPPMGEQPQPELKIELCTPDTVDLPIINLQDVGRPFKIKVSTIRMEFYSPTKIQSLRNKIVKRRMEKMDIKREAQDLKVAEARSTCEEREDYDHVQDQQGYRCRMDLPGHTASVGTRTDYSVGPWDYPACAT
jgi:hypothetical protein